MRTTLFALAAAAVVALTVPASAQVSVHAGDEGVGVRLGHDRDRDRDHNRGWRESHRDCRTIVEKHRTPSGNMVIRKTRRCG
jgi:Ni/Co efflux regulator RcnB